MFVDGCFWHACSEHGNYPVSNSAWWRAKLTRNTERDRDTDERLHQAGWRVVRVWEHEPIADAVAKVEAELKRSN